MRTFRLRLAGQLANTHCPEVLQLLDASVGQPRCWLTALSSDFAWALSKLPAHLLQPLSSDSDIAALFTWISKNGRRWKTILKRLWTATCGKGAAGDLPSAQAQQDPNFACKLCQFSCGTRHALAAHLARRHRLMSKISFFVRDSVCMACHVQFHTRTRLLKHLTKSSPSCRGFHLTHCRRTSLREHDLLASGERKRFRSSKGRGHLRVPARPGSVPIDLGGESSEDELLFYLDDFL